MLSFFVFDELNGWLYLHHQINQLFKNISKECLQETLKIEEFNIHNISSLINTIFLNMNIETEISKFIPMGNVFQRINISEDAQLGNLVFYKFFNIILGYQVANFGLENDMEEEFLVNYKYKLIDNENSYFRIDSNTGEVFLQKILNYNLVFF